MDEEARQRTAEVIELGAKTAEQIDQLKMRGGLPALAEALRRERVKRDRIAELAQGSVALVALDGAPEAITCPAFLCPMCRRPVYSRPTARHPLEGYVIWWEHFGDGNAWQQLGPFIVHRPHCMHAMEALVKSWNDLRWTYVMSRPFGEFIAQLGHNAAHPLEDDKRKMHVPHGALEAYR